MKMKMNMKMMRLRFGNPEKTPFLGLLSSSGSGCSSYSVGILLWLLLVLISSFSRLAVAQTLNRTNPTTDPYEAGLVNSIFQKLGVTSQPTQWNTSGELCSGTAIDNSSSLEDFSPSLKCNCTDRNGTLCHITELRFVDMDLGGSLPDVLWNLTYLTKLDLGQNIFTGPLPAAVSRLTRLQTLNLRTNALSDQLPKELGMLTDLRVLSIGINNFTGSLPPELGNLTRLTRLQFDSSGISGSIPTSFEGLKSLSIVWGSDTQLTGLIPNVISNWSQLSVLRLQGNSFRGPIPPSFSSLTLLTDLRISDLSNASYSLEFIKNMSSLSTLVLRNNNVSGSIPSHIGELPNLTHVDFSFNSLNGSIPDSLFNIATLKYLFLGSNKLTGSLPSQKSSNLQVIDLSYNELSGSFPPWISGQNLQVNLVANNFTLSDSNSSSLPAGLNCLQRTFPCNRGFPIYNNFSINCGGPDAFSAGGIPYEADDILTRCPATHYTTTSRKWAVSNAGLHPDGRYTFTTSTQSDALDVELFKTARISIGSLRYFGLSLENGDYTVNLRFAEAEILNDGFRSLGRRVFDIYVQGDRVEPDVDIRKAAGGKSLSAVDRNYHALVSENYLEIHLFWAGKGTGPTGYEPGADGSYGPFISAIRVTKDAIPAASPTPGKKNQTGLVVGIAVPMGIIGSFLFVFAVYFLGYKRKSHQMPEEFLGMNARPYTFSYGELRAATDDFNPDNKLGEGGFGSVFKGILCDKRVVAVKQLSVSSNQGNSSFMAEIDTIYAVQHRNLVKLHGCCIEGNKRLLVYEYLENGSLAQALFGPNRLHLEWPARFGICLGVARGLAYLHEESQVRIVHRDVKASNILLDSDLNPKISDFGLAKLYDDKKTHISTRVAGTIGYLAPEYAMRGRLTEKADVFGFGVVALEIVSGRPNSNSSLEKDKIYLLHWAWNLHENELDMELVDPWLTEFEADEVKRVILVALLCTQTSPASRPSMSRVVSMLSGDTEVTSQISRPGYLSYWNFKDDVSLTSASGSNYTHSGDDILYDSSISARD